MDDLHDVRRFQNQWIWQSIRPHILWLWGYLNKDQQTQPLQEVDDQERLSIDVVCGLSRSGPISSLRWVSAVSAMRSGDASGIWQRDVKKERNLGAIHIMG
eukprot:Skav227165  [mRNA]  locus=scaffold502:339687:339989:- [translate_table: standard]